MLGALLAWINMITLNLKSFAIVGKPLHRSSEFTESLLAFIGKATKLQRLHLDVDGINGAFLRRIAESCPFLQELRVSSCISGELGVQSLIDQCQFLKWLQIGSDEDMDRYAKDLKIGKYRKINFRSKDTAAGF